MPRMRTLTPGFFSSPYTKLPDAIQLLLLGLATLADDFGVFLWDSYQIKLKLRPGTTESRDEIDWYLFQLGSVGALQRFVVDGVVYGALRNFALHQRPQKPKAYYPCPDNLHEFIGFTPESYAERVKRRKAADRDRTATVPVSYKDRTSPSYNLEGNQDKNIPYQMKKGYQDRALREDLTWASEQLKETA